MIENNNLKTSCKHINNSLAETKQSLIHKSHHPRLVIEDPSFARQSTI
jgi:hypothetical protein